MIYAYQKRSLKLIRMNKNHQMPKPSSEIKAGKSLRDFYLLAREIMIDLCESSIAICPREMEQSNIFQWVWGYEKKVGRSISGEVYIFQREICSNFEIHFYKAKYYLQVLSRVSSIYSFSAGFYGLSCRSPLKLFFLIW